MKKDDNLRASEGARVHGGDPLGANSEIGRRLRQMYETVVSDEVPDRFANLLAQLERAETPLKKG